MDCLDTGIKLEAALSSLTKEAVQRFPKVK